MILNCSDMMSSVHSNEIMEESDGNVAGITFRTSRLGSSLSSMYQNYDFHVDIVRVLVLISLMSATLAITSNLHVCHSSQNVYDCIQLRTHPVDTLNAYNSSLCEYIRQFDLPQTYRVTYRVTVCLFQKEVRIDFRYFINENPTIKGQCNYLKRLVPNIGEAIMRAKNRSNL